MAFNLRNRSFLKEIDFTPREWRFLLAMAEEIKRSKYAGYASYACCSPPAVVTCAGGGGVPVIRDEDRKLRGVEAVVDKDLATARLAEALEADVLMLLTDVPAVIRGFGTSDAAADILAGKPGTIVTPAGDYGGPDDLRPRHRSMHRASA